MVRTTDLRFGGAALGGFHFGFERSYLAWDAHRHGVSPIREERTFYQRFSWALKESNLPLPPCKGGALPLS